MQAEFTEHRILNKNDQKNEMKLWQCGTEASTIFFSYEDDIIFSISSSEVEEEENSNDEDDDERK